jgi:hypothetical protein
MEFWIGLSVGMHLGKLLAQYLEKFGVAYGLLDQGTAEKVKNFEIREAGDLAKVARGVSSVAEDEGGEGEGLAEQLEKVAEEVAEIAEEVGD